MSNVTVFNALGSGIIGIIVTIVQIIGAISLLIGIFLFLKTFKDQDGHGRETAIIAALTGGGMIFIKVIVNSILTAAEAGFTI